MWSPFHCTTGCGCDNPVKCSCFGFSTNSKGELSFKVPYYLASLIDKKDPLKTLRTFVKVLCKYNKSKARETDDVSSDETQKSTMAIGVLEGYLDLIEDLQLHGEFRLLRNREEVSPKKINWKKTLKNEDLIISGKNLLYGSFYSRSKTVNRFNQFYVLYREGLRRACLCLLGLTDFEIDPNFPDHVEAQEKTIQDYLESHFSDRDLWIAKALKKIFVQDSYSTAEKKSLNLIYHPLFEHIWQALVQEGIGAYALTTVKCPTGHYTIKGNNSYGLDLRPDHLVSFPNRNVWILDSKYYCDWEQNSLPGSSDITKQLLYYYLLRTKLAEDQIVRNGFIFPLSPEKKGLPTFQVVGHHKLDGQPESDIICFSLCVEKALNAYSNNQIIEEMVNTLEVYTTNNVTSEKSILTDWNIFDFLSNHNLQEIFLPEYSDVYTNFRACLNVEGLKSFVDTFNKKFKKKLTVEKLRSFFNTNRKSTDISDIFRTHSTKKIEIGHGIRDLLSNWLKSNSAKDKFIKANLNNFNESFELKKIGSNDIDYVFTFKGPYDQILETIISCGKRYTATDEFKVIKVSRSERR